MNATVEISMYPLNADYEPPILDFIRRLNEVEGLSIHTGKLSTLIEGDYDLIMATLTREMKASFEQGNVVSMVMKVLNV